MATVTYGSIGAAVGQISSVAVAYPAGIAAGDMLLLCVANKYPTNGPATPSGFTTIVDGQGTGGAGAAGPDSGDTYATVFQREADGGESGTVTVTVTSGDCLYCAMVRFTKSAGTWSIAACNGGDTSSDTSFSATGNADPGVAVGDVLLSAMALNNNTATGSAHLITQSGATFNASVEILDNATSFGDNVGIKIAYHEVATGPGSAAPTYSATISAAGAGGAVIVRLRANDGGTGVRIPVGT